MSSNVPLTISHFIAMDKFSLKWNDFQTNVSKSFGLLRKEKDFFDVTLVSEDEELVSAHKVVLSASSDFFKNILKKSQQNNPLIYLTGISSRNLQFVMDYIYQGEVKIYQNELDDFLCSAQRLKICGLIGEEEENKPANLPPAAPIKEDGYQPSPVKTLVEEPREEKSFTIATTGAAGGSVKKRLDRVASNQEGGEVAELIERNGELWGCKSCGKTAKTKGNIELHAETHVEGLSFPCKFCDQTFRSRSKLNWHRNRTHRNYLF